MHDPRHTDPMTGPESSEHQMTIDECIEVAEQNLDGKGPMPGPVKASHVERKPLTEDEQRRVTAVQAVKARMARSKALRSIGALPPSSDTLAGDLERSLRRRTGLQ